MHVFLFDIDGTLIAAGGAGKAALEAALAEEFGIDRLADEIDLSGRTDRAILAELVRVHRLDPDPTTHSRLASGYLRHLPSMLASRNGRVLPGVESLLRTLADRRDVAVGLLTGNIRAGADIKLGQFGLRNYFAFGSYGDDHIDRDDVARHAWGEVEARHGGKVRREHVWVIGDTPLDIRCARAVGIRVAAVATGWHPLEELVEHLPDMLLPDLSDPSLLLDELTD